MIDYFLLFISLIIPFGLGMILFYFIDYKKFNFIEKIIICFAFGSVILTFLMFFWGILLLPFYFFLILMLFLTIIISLFFFFKIFKNKKFSFNKFFKKKMKKLSFWEWFFILIILFEIIFVLSLSVLRPITSFDSLAIWALKAKVFFHQPIDFFSKDSSFFLGGISKQNYPLHLPLLMSWIYFWTGTTNIIFVKIIFAIYFIFLIGIVYTGLRSFISRKTSLFFSAILSSTPLVSYHGFSAMADLPLAFYFSLSSIFLFKYFHNTKASYNLYLSGIFAGMLAWIKSEGLILSFVLLFVLLFYLILEKKTRANIKNWLKFLFPYLFLILPWIVFKIYYNLNALSNVDKEFLLFNEFHLDVFLPVFYQIFFSSSFSIWPTIFILSIIFFWRKVFSRPYLYLFLIIFGVILFYISVYVFTPIYKYAINATVVSRNFLVILPLTIFFIALLLEHGKQTWYNY